MKKYIYTGMEGYLLTKSSVLMKRKLSDLIKNAGYTITLEQWIILNTLWDNEGLIQTEIAKKAFKDKTNLTRILDKMERDDLVVRNRSKENRREYRITITKNGTKIFRELIPLVQNHNEKIMQIFESDERNQLIDSLQKLIEAMEE
ncbi:MarR family winged helix-turn-helix transcriptional regulator [uncultured Draconibacterium sp.]|uniref:MarR family winged helix-turn-helix transcriptional regulator n=1 Tax=uncultured Draconibacterium sp. TaxID=1573823 RepID=UPI00374A7C98